tara:strand:- start:267 stop:494 length:228 start_codon:yes stop_codon:yes gene_type:complete
LERIEAIKWAGTSLILTGILLTNLDQYPLNIFFHGAGVLFWSTAGYITNDKPVLANFGLQIPLFVIGFAKLLFDF